VGGGLTRSWDSYFLPGTKVLANKLGLRSDEKLKAREADITFSRLVEVLLQPERVREPGTTPNIESWQRMHAHLFADVYAWAGEIREVPMGKNKYLFADPAEIRPTMQKAFAAFAAGVAGIGDDRLAFCSALAPAFHQLNFAHPFREGNGRTQQAIFQIAAQDCGFDLDWTRISRDQMIRACNDALDGDLRPMHEMFEYATDPAYYRDRAAAERLNIVNVASRAIHELGHKQQPRELRPREGGRHTGMVVAAGEEFFAVEIGRGAFVVFDKGPERVAVDEVVSVLKLPDGIHLTRLESEIENDLSIA
jgi:cell filamentation protein